MPALLFGSISTLADTSEEQRAAFNEAFAEHDLPWRWERDEYRTLLTSNGGADRIATYAKDQGVEVDADAVHATKSRLFQGKLAAIPLRPRPGVIDAIDAARAAGWRVGLVTTTSPENVSGLLDALTAHLDRDSFDVVVDSSSVDEPKPSPAAYEHALKELGLDATEAVAVEDNVGGVGSATSAGVAVVAFPNENTVEHDFGATPVTHHLDFDDLAAAVAGQ
jgi:HAD superfamily hydrolase (TIGR01509 family)